MKNQKEILGVAAPPETCTDRKCPFHGEVKVKEELFQGVVVKKDVNRSATLEWFRPFFVPKYERYEVRRSRLRVHNPACLHAQLGEEVLAARTRPLSKTKNHVILKVLGRAKGRLLVEKESIKKKSGGEEKKALKAKTNEGEGK